MGVRRSAADLDERIYAELSRSGKPLWDTSISWLSSAANHSRISLAGAALLALTGGERGRRTALVGVIAVASTSLMANVVVKNIARRPRPARPVEHYADAPGNLGHVPMPATTSFPSGHSAAAAAFATAVAIEWPAVALPFVVFAALVGYSRVHTGVHYPFDVLGGWAVGVGMGLASAGVVELVARRNSDA